MKKITSILLLFYILSCSAFNAFANEIIDKLPLAQTNTGELLQPLIDESNILPFYDIQHDGLDIFKTYKTGDFAGQFENEALSFVCKAKNDKYIYWVLEDYSEKNTKYVAEEGNKEKLFGCFFDGTVKIPDKAEDVRLSWVESIRSPMFIYYRINEEEFIILSKPLKSNLVSDDGFDAYVPYTTDDFVAYCIKLKAALIAKRADEHGEDYVTEIEGDEVKVTANPKTTAKPMSTQTPKPIAMPKSSDKPSQTTVPTATVAPSDAPTASPELQTLTVSDNGELIIAVDGETINFPDAKPFIDENNRTQVPVRVVSEMLNARVDWDSNTQTVTITQNGKIVKIVIGSDIMTVDRNSVKMDTKAVISEERTYIPVRYVAEALGLTVNWIE